MVCFSLPMEKSLVRKESGFLGETSADSACCSSRVAAVSLQPRATLRGSLQAGRSCQLCRWQRRLGGERIIDDVQSEVCLDQGVFSNLGPFLGAHPGSLTDSPCPLPEHAGLAPLSSAGSRRVQPA